MAVAGVILTGGKSRRMGQPKEWLPILGESLLARVVRTVSEVADPLVVVAAVGQRLPPLPSQVRVACDAVPDCGPLEGMRTGLRTLSETVSPAPRAAVVVSCDLPLLSAAFLRRVVASLESDADAAVPHDGQRLHPLAGVYRLDLLPTVDRLLAADQRRMLDLCAAIRLRQIPAAVLREVDPDLDSLTNVNDRQEFERVCRRLGM